MSFSPIGVVDKIPRHTFAAFHHAGIYRHGAAPTQLVYNYVTHNRKSHLSNNDYMPTGQPELPQRGEAVKGVNKKPRLESAKEAYDALSDEDKEEMKRYIEGKRGYNKEYGDVAKKVDSHIRRHGHITNKEAYERGYTSKLLDTTTFHRCIISKLSIQVGKKRLPDRRIAFYDINRGAPSTFSQIDSELIEDLLSKVDMRFRQHNLRAVLDDQKYPAMRHKGSLSRIRPLLVKAMATKGYSVVGSELIFVRDE